MSFMTFVLFIFAGANALFVPVDLMAGNYGTAVLNTVAGIYCGSVAVRHHRRGI